ncbi:shikimate dehydrogenase [Bacillaceae bacterium SIJ1]|nr:shikimate dehydrogenase [Litoribacterium kuwaitense]
MKLFGLIGHPVGHSLSPMMQNRAFKHIDFPGIYIAYDVKPENLTTAVAGLKALGCEGFNVTIPHKVNVMPLLDEVSEEAKALGAVNTVVRENGRFVGYNTDGVGYLRSLEPELPAPIESLKILMLGAGGAAQALFLTLVNQRPKVLDVVNRSSHRAEQLIQSSPNPSVHHVFSYDEAEQRSGEYDVIINTTAVGMSPNTAERPLALTNVRPGTVVSDIVYNPLKTAFLKTAEEKQCRIHDGVGMFVGQGALAFERWTTQKAPVKEMRETVLQALKR